ncbi:MAG: hypothetical protein ABI330_19700 [Caldimonas sp.]|nr:hypothetical protein [Pseudomonadota bacterium]
MQDELNLLETLGFTLPSPAYIVGAILFGLIGIYAYYVGKHHGRTRTKWLGVALMFYPYAVWNTWILYAVGVALCLAVWWDGA